VLLRAFRYILADGIYRYRAGSSGARLLVESASCPGLWPGRELQLIWVAPDKAGFRGTPPATKPTGLDRSAGSLQRRIDLPNDIQTRAACWVFLRLVSDLLLEKMKLEEPSPLASILKGER
jgi:hypothetical protein